MRSRGDILRFGLLGSAASLLGRWTSTVPSVFADNNLPPSPPTTPFLDPLPLPPAPQTVAPFTVTQPEYQEFINPAKTHFYQLVEETRLVQLHSQLPQPTSIWGYRDSNVSTWPFVPGPTFKVQITEDPLRGNIVRHLNNLPLVANHRGFGLPITTVHLHGGHHLAIADGFSTDIGQPGTEFSNVTFQNDGLNGGFFDYCYPLLSPGFRAGAADTSERPSTL